MFRLNIFTSKLETITMGGKNTNAFSNAYGNTKINTAGIITVSPAGLSIGGDRAIAVRSNSTHHGTNAINDVTKHLFRADSIPRRASSESEEYVFKSRLPTQAR